MEFLDLPREAKALGFSMSEFRAIWDKEMAIKEMAMKEKTLTELSRKDVSQRDQRFPDGTHQARPRMSIQESAPTRQQPADFCSSLATNTQQICELQTVAQSLQHQLTSLRTDLLNQNREALDTVIVPGYGQIKQELEKIRAELAAIKQENLTLKSEMVSQQTVLKKLIENMTFDLKQELEKDIKQLMTDVCQYTMASEELTDSRGNNKRPESIQEEIKLGKSPSISELKLSGADSDETVLLKNDTAIINQENCLLVKSVPEFCKGCGPEWTTFKSTWELTNLPSTTCQYSDYIKPKDWPVSLRFGSWFDLKGKLKVYVDVSERESCNVRKRPLEVKSFGVVHNGSMTAILWRQTTTFSSGDTAAIQEIPATLSSTHGTILGEVRYETLLSEQYIHLKNGKRQLLINVYLQVKEAGSNPSQKDSSDTCAKHIDNCITNDSERKLFNPALSCCDSTSQMKLLKSTSPGDVLNGQLETRPNAPSTNTPSTNAPSTNTPSTNTPSTNTPSTNTSSTNTPSTNTPSTNTPSINTSLNTNNELILVPDMLVKISNVSRLHATKGDYFSSPLYCTQLHCDIILRVGFTNSGYITVGINLLPRDRTAPPKQHTINSCGYILNSNSRGYSRLWSVLNAKRDFPGESPTTIEPVLVLTTSKQNYYKITYQQLQEMGYVLDGCFHIKWSLDVRQIDSPVVTK